MAKIDVFDAAGKKSGSRELSSDLFEAPVSVPLMHQVVVAGLAGLRAGTHSTKTRGEVSGGGKKPWRQKGTGRARQGSIRSPQWVGGGISHGPQPHDHAMRVNKKMKRGALRSALTDTVQSGKIAVISELVVRRAEDQARHRAAVLAGAQRQGRGRVGPAHRGRRRGEVVPQPARRARSPTPAAWAPTTCSGPTGCCSRPTPWTRSRPEARSRTPRPSAGRRPRRTRR